MNTPESGISKVQLGHKLIDETHDEFVVLAKQLSVASGAEFAYIFAEFLAHVEKHFSEEEKLMQDCQDPSIAEHKSEHKRVLGELKQFEKRIAAGRTSLAKAYVKDKLPEWFALHTSTMDSALVAHLSKQK